MKKSDPRRTFVLSLVLIGSSLGLVRPGASLPLRQEAPTVSQTSSVHSTTDPLPGGHANAADIISAIAVLIAAGSFLAGVSAWKREFVGKRQIELAESVLAMFYEAEDAIREIRNPFSFGGEGKTRKRAEHEKEEVSQLLDQAHVVFERYQKREQLFAQLRSSRYRVMAAFGHSAAEPFDEVTNVLSEILHAAHMLGTHYWPRQGRLEMTAEALEKHLVEMHRHEEVFWHMGAAEDKMSPRIRDAVAKMEAITRKAVASQASVRDKVVSWLKGHAKHS